jgi:hypothetical protein
MTTLVYFSIMLYVTINLTIPVVNVILGKRVINRLNNKIVEITPYNEIDSMNTTSQMV